jgi:hypothetical protein
MLDVGHRSVQLVQVRIPPALNPGEVNARVVNPHRIHESPLPPLQSALPTRFLTRSSPSTEQLDSRVHTQTGAWAGDRL